MEPDGIPDDEDESDQRLKDDIDERADQAFGVGARRPSSVR